MSFRTKKCTYLVKGEVQRPFNQVAARAANRYVGSGVGLLPQWIVVWKERKRRRDGNKGTSCKGFQARENSAVVGIDFFLDGDPRVHQR